MKCLGHNHMCLIKTIRKSKSLLFLHAIGPKESWMIKINDYGEDLSFKRWERKFILQAIRDTVVFLKSFINNLKVLIWVCCRLEPMNHTNNWKLSMWTLKKQWWSTIKLKVSYQWEFIGEHFQCLMKRHRKW